MSGLTLQLLPVLQLTDEPFEQFVAANLDWLLELTAKGKLVIMPSAGGETKEKSARRKNDSSR